MRFTKMHGVGNDYIYIDLFRERVDDPARLAASLSRQHLGVGSDGLILIGPSERADFRMIMYNEDGSRGQMCGNGARCVAKYVHDRGLTDRTELTLETDAGVRQIFLTLRDGKTERVTVDMGQPALTFEQVPCTLGTGPVQPVEIRAWRERFVVMPVGMGNPHAVIVVPELPDTDYLARYGERLEWNRGFPARANVEFVQVLSRTQLRMRVWERGSGITLGCGTGACAALVATALRGFCEREAEIELEGGRLTVSWDEETDHVFMTGPATFVFDGEIAEDFE